ncbi:disulfide bond formation protein B [Devosia sp.]|uniref:disulfide bond formation protein B n=1 Tax=Devosia sp. TaxID=1871048 RepID=UPI0025C04961|nr:disulfide bond formation protein B [Devosia sp.]
MTETAVRTDQTQINMKDGATIALLAAWVLALFAAAAVLFIGEVMGQQPCVLCWYQRAAMFPLALLLGIAAWRGDLGVWRYALPITGAGILIAAFHTLLYYGVIPESIEPCGAGPSCTDAAMTILELPIPVLSLAAFVGLSMLLVEVRKGEPR